MSEQQPTTQQRIATAIGTVIIPMVETGGGIYGGPLEEFILDRSIEIIWRLKEEFTAGRLKPKQP